MVLQRLVSNASRALAILRGRTFFLRQTPLDNELLVAQ